MSTSTVIHRRQENVTGEAVINIFRTSLEERQEQFGQSEIEKLSALYAKNPTDNFIVYDKADLECPLIQGDIQLYHESSDYYKEAFSTVTNLRDSKNMNLQEGVSVTGDHRIVPVEGSNMVIKEGQFYPLGNIMRGRRYDCKTISTDKPFLITHREHGNIAVPEGNYLVFTAIDPQTHTRVLD